MLKFANSNFGKWKVKVRALQKRKGSGQRRSPSDCDAAEGLVQLIGDVAERAVQLGAEALHDRDDRDGDAGSDQAVFDGRRARLVLGKALEGLHLDSSFVDPHVAV